ncbi:MAG: heme-binding domain-containing protein [Planctomycetaceae bacterium]|nr:heme-binding domain-containing protein [Planctomycetaceae bacterium]
MRYFTTGVKQVTKYLLLSGMAFMTITGSGLAAGPKHASRGAQEAAADRPLQALLVTGGCCHDYARQQRILTRGISARADVVWTVVNQGGATTNTKIPLYRDPEWSRGFDVVVHNECFADVRDKEFVERIIRPHREGVPAVLIHCAMHCYRTGDDQWFEFVGVQSPGHGPKYAYTVDNLRPNHPIMGTFGERFTTPQGELYHAVKLFDTATPLAHAKRKRDQQPQVCIWINQYGKGKVFATTIGHHNATMVEPVYLDVVTKGLLWACGKDPVGDFRRTTGPQDAEFKKLASAPVQTPSAHPSVGKPLVVKCCGAGNLLRGGQARASSEESNKRNFARHAIDGDLSTRWCAQGGQVGESWRVDLGTPQDVRSLRIHWEKKDAIYRYRIEASADAKSWKVIVDQSMNKRRAQIIPHKVDAPKTRHLRVTFLGSKPAYWASFWELEAYADEGLPPLPKATAAPAVRQQLAGVEVPRGFKATLFGAPPVVTYPVCLTAAATGEVFVGVDEQGSLGKEEGGGRVLRCRDTDGDGEADQVNVFARMEHPRGLIYDNGSLWVLHPPLLSVFHDDDRDGTADRNEILVTGLTTDEISRRGADHTTNGIRMGIDGWIYIAVGDFGFTEARGKDGRKLGRRGGGIVRVRPDGTEMEFHNWGQRNILDVCIDPYMNLFTRDNTNDGGGWDIRLSHIFQSGEYGYPSLYLNFTEESLPPLADYGGGSGCGGMYLHDLRWPAPFGDAVYTCDWGRSEVYRHNLPRRGPTFAAHQEVFMKIPRPTDIDMDGSGRMYVSSWKNGKFAFTGPDVGFVAQITPIDFIPQPFPDMETASDTQLVAYFGEPSAAYRLHAQRELLRRGSTEDRWTKVAQAAGDPKLPLYGRVAAIYTLSQFGDGRSRVRLLQLASDDSVREFALRALTDRKEGLVDLPLTPFVAALQDANPRVRAQALICLGRLGRAEAGLAMLPLTRRAPNQPKPTAKPLYKQPDPGRVIPHLAVRALADCNAVKICLDAIPGPYADGALQVLKTLHQKEVVRGLASRLSRVRDGSLRRRILTVLVRLYFREGEYKGGWWGTRPDRTGPYFDRQPWAESSRIEGVLTRYLKESDQETAKFVGRQLARHQVKLAGLREVVSAAQETVAPVAIRLPKVAADNPNLIGNLKIERVQERALEASGNQTRGAELFKRQSCQACHTTADGQVPKGPHLVDIGKRYKKRELIESVLNPNAKLAQGFESYLFVMESGKVFTGFVTGESVDKIDLRQTDGIPVRLVKKDIEQRQKRTESMMPAGLVNNLTPEQLADLVAYLRSLE